MIDFLSQLISGQDIKKNRTYNLKLTTIYVQF